MPSSETLKPLIKYTGGKYKEYKFFKEHIPSTVNDYYEPFFGGGGVFFRMHSDNIISGHSYINDISTDLMNFYSSITKKEFIEELYKLVDVWGDVLTLGTSINEKYGELFLNVIHNENTIDEFLTDSFRSWLEEEIAGMSHLSEYNTHGYSLCDKIIDGLKSKMQRFIMKNISFEEEDVSFRCITTSVCQSFYFTVREMYNEWLLNPSAPYTETEKSVQWFFIREFCFGSMFRFGGDGKFNVPYGGFSYNKKCLRSKVNEIAKDKTQRIFSKTKIFSQDFDKFMKRKFQTNDFMFLDPPYDATFSEYDNNSFTRNDHIRLKERLDNIKCKWLIVLRKTDFISELYKDYPQIEFNKTYSYQARGTYDSKKSIHLIIKNY